jgi:hypothetical protein
MRQYHQMFDMFLCAVPKICVVERNDVYEASIEFGVFVVFNQESYVLCDGVSFSGVACLSRAYEPAVRRIRFSLSKSGKILPKRLKMRSFSMLGLDDEDVRRKLRF